MRRGYSPEGWEYQEREPRQAGTKGVLVQRTKTVKTGSVLEAEIYPVVDWEHARGAKSKKTPEQMQRVNMNNARKQLARLANTNFGPGDLLIHLTSGGEDTEEEFMRITRRFFARLRYAFRKLGKELKYLYVIEGTGTDGRKRWHIHGLVNGGALSRDEVEQLWGHGLARVDRVQKQEGGLTGFALYITQRKSTQERMMRRRWAGSRNLKKPTCTVSSSKFSRAAAAKIEKGVREDARALFEKKYPGYRLVSYEVKYSDFLPGVYIYAVMEKRE